MKKKLTTRERKCPKCGRSNIVDMGSAHVTGSGQPMRDVDQFQYRCRDCNTEFWSLGKREGDS